jgi:hypothetical protein
MKDNKNKKERSPLDRSPPLRVAGQSLDHEIEKLLDDHAVAPYMLATMMVTMAGFEWWRYLTDVKPSPYLFSVVAVLTVIFAVYKILKTRKQAKLLVLGRDGERAVAEHLEWLRAHDFVVMHDIPNGDANVDHVLIGPQGVYTIETKTRSKPQRGPCRITVEDGVIRANGQAFDRDPIVQAKAQAGWLKAFLAESQFQVSVQPVVVVPGWFVEPFDMKKVGAWVLEIKALKAFVVNQPRRHTLPEVRAMASALRSHVRSLSKK